ncbi:hypothetical protein ACQ86N_44255 [Puia sp. P3]|uniref:hypothetical protein n=1 Tax=Puia sp. P3 TaxID=3423952 RepID=UPI003D676F7D
MKHLLKPFVGFLLLFLLYHSAEYMIVFRNSIFGFLSFQLAFFASAYFIAAWQAAAA